MQLLLGMGNAFPERKVPEIYRKLQVGRFYEGFITYSDLSDREESGELFEAAYTYMIAYTDAERVIQQLNEARARAQAGR